MPAIKGAKDKPRSDMLDLSGFNISPNVRRPGSGYLENIYF